MSPFQRSIKALKHHRPGMVGVGVVVVFVCLAALAPWLAPSDPFAQSPELKFVPPFWQDGGNWLHPFGTDILGRDVLSRLLFGARLSLVMGFITVLVGAGLGVPLGMMAGYFGSWLDLLAMRLVDLMLAFPSILLAVCIVAILGPSLENAMVAIGVVSVPQYARVVRAAVLAEKEREYVAADVALGKKQLAILFGAILPNVISPLLVISTLNFATAVLETAGLSFIGLGAQPPTPEWGALLFEGKSYVYNAPWLILFPGIAILLTVLGFNLFGDALRDVLDPKSLRR